jgi:hypothetical protein
MVNSAGHLQFFTPKSFEAPLARNRIRIFAKRRYVPVLDLDTIRLPAVRHQVTALGEI